jgi:regulator of ribonuclease activity A
MFKTADLCDDHSDNLQIARPGLLNYGGRTKFYGKIVTVKLHEDNSLVREILNADGHGMVLVVDGGGSTRCALLGDILAAKAVENGWQGVIINGCIRDSVDIHRMKLGVKALGTHPLKSVKHDTGQLNVPVHFGRVTYTPGEYLYADEDGTIISPVPLF